MISTISFSFDLTYTNPGTGALQPRGVIVDSTDYIGLGLDPIIYELKGLGQVTFNGDIIVDGNSISSPIIDLQGWNFVDDGVPTAYFDLPLDLNGNVANGVYTFIYRLRVNSFTIPVAITLTPPDLINVASNQWITQYLEVGNVIRLADPGVDFEDVTVEALEQVDADAEITVSDYTIPVAEIILFDLQNVQFNGVYTYSGCTQVNADVSFTYDCEYGDSGTWGVANTTPLASNEVVASLSCSINYPSWTTLSPTFPGNIVTNSLPYPPAGTETPLATGTYSVSLTQQIQQTQTSGLVVLYTKSVVKEFQVSCAGSLCGLTPCIENLRAAHAVELQRNRISKYQVFVDNVLLYYAEAQNYRACGDTANYRATLELIKQNLDSSGCECACCDENTYYWVSNNSGESVIESLIRSFQFRLFSLTPAGPGSPTVDDDETQGVEVGALWQNTDTGIIYRCTENTASEAVWVEYYAPGVLPIALDVPATPNLPYLSSDNVQDQLGQANTQFAAQLLANAQFNADITDLQNTVTALDGINGLTRVGDDFRLGGTLDAATTIDVDGNSLSIVDATNPLVLLVDGAFPSVGQNLVLQTSVDGGSGANGIGSSIEFQAETTAGAVNRTAVIRSRWTDAAAQDSDFQIAITEGGLLDIGLTVNADKSVTLNGYNSTTFEDPAPAYLLGVDASGNVVQTTSSSGPLVYVGRVTGNGPTASLTQIFNNTGATITLDYATTGQYLISASSSVFANAAIFITPVLGSTFSAAIYSNSIDVSNYNLTGTLADLISNARIKIEIYP
jgi:sulfur carrier protein ThiS